MLSGRYPVLWVGQAAVISAPIEIDAIRQERIPCAAAVKRVFAVTGASVLIDIRPTVADALIGPG